MNWFRCKNKVTKFRLYRQRHDSKKSPTRDKRHSFNAPNLVENYDFTILNLVENYEWGALCAGVYGGAIMSKPN